MQGTIPKPGYSALKIYLNLGIFYHFISLKGNHVAPDC